MVFNVLNLQASLYKYHFILIALIKGWSNSNNPPHPQLGLRNNYTVTSHFPLLSNHILVRHQLFCTMLSANNNNNNNNNNMTP
jgi:hypothetical protein